MIICVIISVLVAIITQSSNFILPFAQKLFVYVRKFHFKINNMSPERLSSDFFAKSAPENTPKNERVRDSVLKRVTGPSMEFDIETHPRS